MSFYKKYPFLSIFTMLVSFFALILFFYFLNIYKNIEIEKNQMIANTTSKKSKLIHDTLINTKNDILFFSQLYRDLPARNEEKISRELQKTLKTYAFHHTLYQQVRYLNLSGQEIFRINNKNSVPIIVESSKLQNKSNRYYFKDSLSLGKHEIYLSPFDLNVENGKIEQPYNPTLRFSTPLMNTKNTIHGYALVNYSGQQLLTELAKGNNQENIILLNKKGEYLLSPNHQYQWQFMFNNSVSLQKHNPKLWAAIQNNEKSYHDDIALYSFEKIDPIEIISPHRKVESRREWILISSFKYADINSEFMKSIEKNTLPLILFFIFIVFISYLLSFYLKKLSIANERVKISSAAFKHSAQGIMVLNENGKVIQINKGFTKITGYDFEDIYLKNPKVLKDATHEYKEDFFTELWNTLRENHFWEGQLYNIKKDGTKFIEQLTTSTIVEKGKIQYYVGVFSDITKEIEQKEKIECTNKELKITLDELKNAQEQLIESEKLSALGQLIAGIAHEINSPLGAIKTSSEYVLEAMEKTIKNRPLVNSLLSKEEEKMVEDLELYIYSNSQYLSIKEQRGLKKEITKMLLSSDIKDERYIADILSQFNFELEKVEKYMVLLKHPKIKFILNTIHDEFIAKSNISIINNSVSRAAKTIFALKKFVHFDHDREGRAEKLEESIESVLILLRHNLKHNIEIIKEYDDVPPIYCYADELGQVWMNLITNAVQAMNNSGQLCISIYEEESYQVVCIADNGPGVPLELQDKIFKPFFTTKEAGVGSGLGLDIVRKVVDAHKGEIEFRSSEKGTTFCIKIPKKEDV